MSSTSKVFKYVNVLVLTLITLAICYTSLQSMRANAWYFNAKNTLQEITGNNIDIQQLNLADNAISLASSLDPTHPHYLQLMAHVKLLKLAVSTNQPDDIAASYQQIEQLLLKSVALRETWSETWIALAKVVSYQNGPTDRVYDYIQQAKRVGPYKIEVHLGAIEIALMNWQQLSPKYKALYVNELKLAAKHGHKFSRAFDIAKQVDALPILCLSLKFGAHFEPVRNSWMFKKQCK